MCRRYSHLPVLLVLLALARLPSLAQPPASPATVAGYQAALAAPHLPDTLRVRYTARLADLLRLTDLAAAHTQAQQALTLAQRLRYAPALAYAAYVAGAVETSQANVLAAYLHYQLALRTYQALHDQLHVGKCLEGLGSVYSAQHKQAQAVPYYQQADSIYRRLTPPYLEGKLSVLGNLAGCYQALQRLPEARRYSRQLLALTRTANGRFDRQRVAALNVLAAQQNQAGHPDSATVLQQEGLALARHLPDAYLEMLMLNALTHTAVLQRRLPAAERLAQQAVALGYRSKQDAKLEIALGNLSVIMHTLGRPAAYDTLSIYNGLHEDLHDAEQARALTEAQTRYDVAGQQARIRELEQARRLANQTRELTRLRTQQALLGTVGAATLLLLLAGAGFWYYRRRQQAQQAQAAAALRQRLAADLHDDVGNLLTQIGMHSSLLRETPHSPAQTVARLDAMAIAARQAAQQMSDVVWGLDAKHISLSQLLARMRDHAQEVLPPAGLDVRFRVPADLPDPELSPNLGHNLYLIYKEALHNVVKHAQATTVTVQLAATAAGLALTVADDGCGHRSQLRPGGHGLVNMQARAQAVGGTVCYESQPTGFAVVTTLPLD